MPPHNVDKNTEEWLHRHKIRMTSDIDRYQIYQYAPYKMRYCGEDLYQTSRIDTEPLYTLKVPKSTLDRIVEDEANVLEQLQRSGNKNHYMYLVNQQKIEEEVRSQNPAVGKAYEQYRMLYKLAIS